MTGILLDTHALLWFLWDDARLSQTAKAQIEAAENRKVVSVASGWEIAIKVSCKKLALGEPSSDFLVRELAHNNLDVLPIELRHVTEVEHLPFHHRDPFDRLLVAQALVEQLTLVSADSVFDQYQVPRIW